MATMYDSEAIREAARHVRTLRLGLEGDTAPETRRASREAEELKGKTAEALTDTLASLEARIRRLSGELNAVERELNRYAGQLEATAAELKTQM